MFSGVRDAVGTDLLCVKHGPLMGVELRGGEPRTDGLAVGGPTRLTVPRATLRRPRSWLGLKTGDGGHE